MPRPTVYAAVRSAARHRHHGSRTRRCHGQKRFLLVVSVQVRYEPERWYMPECPGALDQESDSQIGAHVRKWKFRLISSKRCSEQAWTHCSMPGSVSIGLRRVVRCLVFSTRRPCCASNGAKRLGWGDSAFENSARYKLWSCDEGLWLWTGKGVPEPCETSCGVTPGWGRLGTGEIGDG